jgi:REP element-mobilizing transposase RayT
MGDLAIAYHITFGTYGARLHGGPRDTVDRRRNAYGQPVLGQNEARERMADGQMKHQPILLTADQRIFVQEAVEGICDRGGWEFIQTACGPDHVHVLLSSQREPKAIRRWLKRWLGEAMSTRRALPDGQSWWAKGGSTRSVWDEKYLRNVDEYLREQRA